MRVLLLVFPMFLTFDGHQINAQVVGPCSFTVSGAAPPVTLVGTDDLVQRVRMLAQPDSPVVMTSLDLTETQLVVGAGAYEKTGRFTLEVMNVSDRPVADIRVVVQVEARWTKT